ncbi:hypothetical protein [Nostoc sp. PA-18-2419]|uniref:hypothetical protein n=1 Tax=Nostoc sp. PA-18-2419 TaxID=2575443 RepID=UPI001108FE3D|nr:hypothetical protein [Nostoc sp. PA-18-2419]
MSENSSSRDLVLATVIIRRLVPNWQVENTGEPNQIHAQLLDLVIEFARNEESGWADVVAVQVTEEELGNFPTTNETQTGQKFTGESDDTGRRKKDLAKEDLATSQPG